MEKTDIKSLYFSELEQMLGEMGEKPFRAGQIFGRSEERRVGKECG